ncbi:MAG TPA: hypothetical protein DCE44_10100, partial [Verrucomicrobiales bacterium]|nr:hypothetical protein [Verrucomicrobiales bacterium]
MRYPQPLGTEVVRTRLNAVVATQPALRVSLDLADLLNPRQFVNPAGFEALEEANFIANGESENHLRSILKADRARPFKLDQAPLFRVTVVNPGQPGECLVLTVHAALLDYSSIRRMSRWLAEGPPSIEELTPQPDGIDQPPSASVANPAYLEAFWKPRLRDRAPTLVASDSSAPTSPRSEALSVERLVLGQDVPAALEQLAVRLRIRPEVVIEVAWGLLLSKLGRTETPQFGVWGESDLVPSNRPLGIHGNLVPMRLEIRPNDSVVAHLTSTARERSQICSHLDVSIFELADWAGLKRGEPLFDSAVRCR